MIISQLASAPTKETAEDGGSGLVPSFPIAESVIFDRTAPVSDLFVFGSKQDLAFKKEIGKSTGQLCHESQMPSNRR